MEEPNTENLVSFKQLLERHPWMTERWLRRAVQQKRLPYYKVDGRLIFDLDEVNRYVLKPENRVEASGRRFVRPRIPRKASA
jgi:hypothetical protein